MNEQKNKIIIYESQDGRMKLEVKLENETVWLSQKQMAELFGCSIDNVSLHLINVFNEAELSENQTTEDSSIVQKEGNKEVRRSIKLYNLDAIISVGYRINSLRGTQFRIWATQKLKEYIIKGFVLDDEKLAGGQKQKTYFQELEERIRKIRTSEANFYQKVKEIFATSIDYDPRADYAKQFFAVVQNKFHYAITGLTAAEIIHNRIDSNKVDLGLTNWQGEIITREQAEVAKNYLEEMELRRLNLLVEQFLSYAELRSVEERATSMKDWLIKLDAFLTFNEKKILTKAGVISHDVMEEKVRAELAKYNQQRLN
jgi:hypothetical protein